MIRYGDFPVRPAYRYGESLTSYVYRIYSANGHNLYYPIHNELGQLCSLSSDNISLAQLKSMESALSPLCSFSAADWLAGSLVFQKVRSRTLKRDDLKFCPLCIRAHQIHFNLWELPLFDACPLHNTQLLSQCGGCRQPLKWSKLRPDWRCGCGMSLSEMSAVPAHSVDYSLARLIVTGSDVQIPSNISLDIVAVQEIPLEIIYKLLERFRKIRVWIILSVLRGSPPSDLDQEPHWIRRAPHLWECRLLAQWPGGLHNSMLRLARRFWRRETSTFISLHRNAIVIQTLQHLIGNEALTPENSLLTHAVRLLVEQERAPLRLQNVVIFNPALSNIHRHQKLRLFRDWWRKNCQLNQKHFRERPEFLNFPSSRFVLEETVVDTLNELMRFSESEADLPTAAAIHIAANGLSNIDVDEDADAFLLVLSSALLKVPHAHLLTMIKELSRAQDKSHGTKSHPSTRTPCPDHQ